MYKNMQNLETIKGFRMYLLVTGFIIGFMVFFSLSFTAGIYRIIAIAALFIVFLVNMIAEDLKGKNYE
jgi:hypothetical protein